MSDAPRPETPSLPGRLPLDMYGGCNLNCRMCLAREPGRFPDPPARRVMPVEKIDAMTAEVAPAGALVFTAVNGESLLGPNWREQFRAARRPGVTLVCHTNGTRLDPDAARFLVELGVDAVSVSIDAFRPETYRAIRGVDALDRARDAVGNLLEARGDRAAPRVEVSFVRQDDNIDEETDFVDFWTDHVDVIRVNTEIAPAAAANFANLPLPDERVPCGSLYHTLPVLYDGRATLCCRDAYGDCSPGNVFESSVADVWRGERMERFRRLHEAGEWDRIPLCRGCDGWAGYEFREERTDRHLIRRSIHMTYYNVLERLEGWNDALRGSHHRAPAGDRA